MRNENKKGVHEQWWKHGLTQGGPLPVINVVLGAPKKWPYKINGFHCRWNFTLLIGALCPSIYNWWQVAALQLPQYVTKLYPLNMEVTWLQPLMEHWSRFSIKKNRHFGRIARYYKVILGSKRSRIESPDNYSGNSTSSTTQTANSLDTAFSCKDPVKRVGYLPMHFDM